MFLMPAYALRGRTWFIQVSSSCSSPVSALENEMFYSSTFYIVNPNNPVQRNRKTDLFLFVGLKLPLHVVSTCMRMQVVLVLV